MSGPLLLALRILLVVALYAFLSWALYTVWRDLKRQSMLLTSPQVPPLTLIQKMDGISKPYRFTIPEITIGRDPACDVPLQDKTISVQHARLLYHHSQWWVEDLHSTNGTFLNQEPVSEPVVIAAGDQLRCGQLLFLISLGESEPLEIDAGV
jgi:pSer/pThr/pTyr-binding forkhead associated (FHA) protein